MTDDATTKAVKPYAYEFGKSNGDGTFSVVIERGDPEKPVSDWPIKPLFSSAATPSADKGVVTEAMVEIAAKAMDDAEFGFTLNLTRLVDGVSTYTLTYSDGSPPLQFGATDEAYEHVAQRKRLTQARAAITAALGSMPVWETTGIECHKSDTPDRVCFYEQDFYVLSNFSSFSIMWEWTPRDGLVRFDTSEAVYHFMKFKATVPTAQQFQLMERIRRAPSAHEAFKLAESNKHHRRPDWEDVKVNIMRDILRAKAEQHEYVRRKLLATGDRELVEDSWRDDFWGWGPNRDGKNMLGKLWMEIRTELRATADDGKMAEAIHG